VAEAYEEGEGRSLLYDSLKKEEEYQAAHGKEEERSYQ